MKRLRKRYRGRLTCGQVRHHILLSHTPDQPANCVAVATTAWPARTTHLPHAHLMHPPASHAPSRGPTLHALHTTKAIKNKVQKLMAINVLDSSKGKASPLKRSKTSNNLEHQKDQFTPLHLGDIVYFDVNFASLGFQNEVRISERARAYSCFRSAPRQQFH